MTAANFDQAGLFYDKSTELVIKVLYLVFYYMILIEKDLEGKDQVY